MRWKKFGFLVVCIVLIVLINFMANLNAQSIDTIFTLYECGGCSADKEIWVEVDDEGEPIAAHETRFEENWCLGTDGEGGTSDDCCPVGYECLEDEEEGVFICELTELLSILSCEDYNEENRIIYNNWVGFDEYATPQELCEADPLGRADVVGYSGTEHVEDEQYIVTLGECIWKDGECISESTTWEHIGDELFKCEKVFTKEILDGNKIKYSWTAEPKDETATFEGLDDDTQQLKLEAAGCVSGSKIIKYSVTKLNFFNFVQFFVAIFLIAIIYFVKLNQKQYKC